MIHDAHVHIWAEQAPYPQYEVIPGFRATAQRLLSVMDTGGVGRAAVVTPRCMGWDNSVTLAAAELAPARIVPIGLIDPQGADPGADLRRQTGPGRLAGVRLSPFNEPEQTWLTGRRLWPFWEVAQQAQIPVHLHIRPDQLPELRTVAERWPGAPLVIDHLGRPDPVQGVASREYQTFLELARFPQVWVKTPDNGFFSQQRPPFLDLLPFIRTAVAAYGAQRLLWGSDWPLSLLYGEYADAEAPWASHTDFLSEQERTWIFAANFDRLYPAPHQE